MSSEENVVFHPIGLVKTTASGDEVKDRTRISEIEIKPELVEALNGIEEYSHLFVLFYLHQIPDSKRKTLKVHPRGRVDMPVRGIFAVRTNLRANPIGLTLVELIKVERNVLNVRGLDAYDGTPVLDIKPYDFWDCAQNARVPDWWRKLNTERQR